MGSVLIEIKITESADKCGLRREEVNGIFQYTPMLDSGTVTFKTAMPLNRDFDAQRLVNKWLAEYRQDYV